MLHRLNWSFDHVCFTTSWSILQSGPVEGNLHFADCLSGTIQKSNKTADELKSPRQNVIEVGKVHSGVRWEERKFRLVVQLWVKLCWIFTHEYRMMKYHTWNMLGYRKPLLKFMCYRGRGGNPLRASIRHILYRSMMVLYDMTWSKWRWAARY